MATGLAVFQPSPLNSQGYNNDSNSRYKLRINRNDGNWSDITTEFWLNYYTDANDKRVVELSLFRSASQSANNSPYSVKPFSECVHFYYANRDYITFRTELFGGPTQYNYNTLKSNVDAAIANGTLTEIQALPSGYRFNLVSDNAVGSINAGSSTYATRKTVFNFYPIVSSTDAFYLIYVDYDLWTFTPRNVTYNLTNCTTNKPTISYFQTSVIITPDTDYEFTSVDDVVITGVNVTSKRLNTNGTISFNMPYGDDSSTILITGNATQTGSKASFTANCTNCTCSLANGSYNVGDTLTAIFTPNNNYDLTVNDIGFNISNVTLNEVNNTVVATWIHSESTTVVATGVRYQYVDTSLVFNATCSVTNVKLRANVPYHIVVTSANGFYFDTAPTFKYQDSYASFHTVNFVTDDSSEYPTVFYYDFTLTNESHLSIKASAIAIPITVDEYGFIRVYKPSVQNLKDLAAVRFTAMSNTDLGEFILSLKKLYVNVPTPNSEQMKFGDYQSSIVSNVVEIQTITTDLGTIDINYYFNNEMDYKNTDIDIYLPFIGFERLDAYRVMNHTLHLYYVTNILTGDTVVFIDDENNNTVVNYSTNLAYDIPYILAPNYNIDVKNSLEINARYLYGFVPYVVISRNLPYNTSNINSDKNEYVLLDTLSGYNEVDVLNVTVGFTRNEREELQQILRNGVIF